MAALKINPKVIDIYHGDTVNDFHALYAAGIRGVIHKATEGIKDVDPAYAHRRKLATDAGLLWGAYHFNSGDPPFAQVAHFLAVADADTSTMLALDFEDCPSNMNLGALYISLGQPME